MENESTIRLALFFGIFAVMALWEILSPRRPLTQSKGQRWFSNISLVVFNTLLLRLLFPTATLGAAYYAQHNNWGLFNQFEIPSSLVVVLSVLLLDLLIYWQHRIVHVVPLFWRFHRVHHVDPDLDVTSGARFHPVEIIFSMLIKISAILLLGVPPLAALIFEAILSSMAMFNHSNINLPERLDRIIRLFVVTPDMHRVHHSTIRRECDSNYGFNLSIWDRLFGSYTAAPERGQLGMTLGVKGISDPTTTIRLKGMMLLPFRRETTPSTEH